MPRLTFGIPQLLDGIDVVVVAVGLFAVGEVLYAASRAMLDDRAIVPSRGSLVDDARRSGRDRGSRGCAARRSDSRSARCRPAARRFRRSSRTRSSGASRDTRSEFGHGAIEGVAGPEAANNAAAAGTLVPLLTLGLPTTATAAILLAAFQQYGLQPGPLLFQHEPRLVWGLIASLYVGNVMLLVLNLPLVGALGAAAQRSRGRRSTRGILMLASAGAYSVNRSVFDVGLLYAIGARRLPDAAAATFRWRPAIIGLILGPMAEQQLRRALAIAEGSPVVLVTRPFSLPCSRSPPCCSSRRRSSGSGRYARQPEANDWRPAVSVLGYAGGKRRFDETRQ